ncbi:5467_t:CDS:1, partial [Cetraspora pellucida]
ESLTSTVPETDMEVNLESSSWSEEVEVETQSLTLVDNDQAAESATTKSNSLIPKFKSLSDPLAAIYSSKVDLTTNTQDENNDGFTLVSSKRKPKNRPKATELQEN